MVSLEQMRASNARIPECLPAGLVAVFVGGTSGIGENTMKQFVKHAIQPRIYFVGRSERAAARITAELAALNPGGKYRFIRADLSLLQNVDNVCRQIKDRETHVNLLFLTSGTMVTGRDTPEALYYPTAVTYYARIRFITNLLPLLQKATALRRVVSVFGGTKEGPVATGDLQGRSLHNNNGRNRNNANNTSSFGGSSGGHGSGSGVMQLRAHTASMMTLALESLAYEAPDVSFVHSFPGFVRTGLGKDVRAASAMGLMKVVIKVVGPMVMVPVSEAGERQLFVATSGRFPARGGLDVAATAGVVLEGGTTGRRLSASGGGGGGGGIVVAKGSDARMGSGVYSVNFDGEPQGEKVEEAVQRLRDADLVRRLWLHTVGEFVRVTGSEFV